MKKKIEVFVHQRLAGFMKGSLRVTDFDLTTVCSEADAVRLIAVKEVEIDVPEDDLDLLEIEALEAKIVKEKGESQHKANLLLDRISKLKAIGHEDAA